MAHYITTHDTTGTAVFSPKAPGSQHSMPIPIGDIRIISSSHQIPLNLSNESDIDQYQHDRTSPFFPGERRICPDNGTATCIISMAPRAESGMHRTMTVDTIVFVEGEVEITLDSGEMRRLKAGDSLVQRGTMHKWRNVTPNDGWARWVVFIQAAAESVKIGDRVLGNEWVH
jgi:mannose-6-phosphate isomerase-like protein (cupin superfamily)